MVELRTAPLSGHAEYFLDCAVDSYELDACSHFILRLFGQPEEVEPIVGPKERSITEQLQLAHDASAFDIIRAIETNRDNLRTRRAKCSLLADVADATLLRLEPETAGGLIYHGLSEIPSRIEGYAEICAGWAVTDETVGGDLKPFRDRERIDQHDDPPPRLARRLASPRFIRNFLRHNSSIPELFTAVDRVLSRAAFVSAPLLCSRFGEIQRLLASQMRRERDRRFAEMVSKRPKIENNTKRVLKRAAATAVSVVGPEKVSAFIRGDEVSLPGERVTLVIARRGSLAAVGHGQIAVSVKDDEGELAQLCVYFEGTPVLDQLVAFALNMQSGLEEELIGCANVVSATERGRAHPALRQHAEKLQRQIQQAEAITFGPRSRGQSRYDRDRARTERYWARTGPIWIDRLSTQVLGRRRHWLEATIAAGRNAERPRRPHRAAGLSL